MTDCSNFTGEDVCNAFLREISKIIQIQQMHLRFITILIKKLTLFIGREGKQT